MTDTIESLRGELHSQEDRIAALEKALAELVEHANIAGTLNCYQPRSMLMTAVANARALLPSPTQPENKKE